MYTILITVHTDEQEKETKFLVATSSFKHNLRSRLHYIKQPTIYSGSEAATEVLCSNVGLELEFPKLLRHITKQNLLHDWIYGMVQSKEEKVSKEGGGVEIQVHN